MTYNNESLNNILFDLRENYKLQFSYDDKLLSEYKVSINEQYTSETKLIEDLIINLPLGYEKSGEVFIIYPIKDQVAPKLHSISGQILEEGTRVPLPFSHVLINNYATITDIKGAFSMPPSPDSLFHVTASHLGCFIMDTTVTSGSRHLFYLIPSSVGLPEVTIKKRLIDKSTQMGEQPGLIKLNHYIANYLPGNGDNSVFNLLRLQPGILAAGEQSNDLIIWGSPEGTSRVLFDGFTIWGLRNFSDNISAVNPYLAKNVEIMKGGYDAKYGDVAGGLVNIIGANGNQEKAGLNLFVNNQTVNGMVEVPIFKKSSVMLAFRKSYTNLIDANKLKFVDKYNNNNNNEYKLNVNPNYIFQDANFKYTLQGDNKDLFYISMLTAKDEFSYDLEQPREKTTVKENTTEDNIQRGGTMFYGKSWKNGNSSDIKVSYSSFTTDLNRIRNAHVNRNDRVLTRRSDLLQNDVAELEISTDHRFLINEKHLIETGFAVIENKVLIQEDSFEVNLFHYQEQAQRLNLFVQDNIQLSTNLQLKVGVRANKTNHINSTFIDPRVSVHFKPSSSIKLNFAYGIYRQFLVKSSIVDENGTYKYSWILANETEIPVMKSQHLVGGITFSKPTFTASLEGFHKKHTGLTRYVKTRNIKDIYEGNSRSYGFDLYLKKEFGKHSIWSSYSLGKTEELFDYFREQTYRRSPHDQRHELKLAALFNFGHFYFSGNYVYGSGFPIYTNYLNPDYTEKGYNRMDVSAIYTFDIWKMDSEIGLSILNVLDANNTTYSSFERIPFDQLSTIFTSKEAISFTPLLYFKMHL